MKPQREHDPRSPPEFRRAFTMPMALETEEVEQKRVVGDTEKGEEYNP